MAYQNFQFLNKTESGGQTGAGKSDQYGANMSPFQGPDGSAAGTPPKAILASICIGQPTGDSANNARTNSLANTGVDFDGMVPGPAFLTPNNISLGALQGTPGYFMRTCAQGFTTESNTGVVYIWSRDLVGNWTLTGQSIAGVNSGDLFGWASAIYGDYMAISALGYNGGAYTGRVYLYQLIAGTWTQIQILSPGDLSAGDQFGICVRMVGDFLFIGANTQATNTGALYVFQNQAGTWTQIQKLVGFATNDFFGNSVDYDGNYLIVGAPQETGGAGYAEVYQFDTGTQTFAPQFQLTGSGTVANDFFGNSVAVMNGLFVVGAPSIPSGGKTGQVFVFVGSVQEQIITPFDGVAGSLFGYAVGVYNAGTTAFIAAGAPNNVNALGFVYFYTAPDPTPAEITIALKGIKVY